MIAVSIILLFMQVQFHEPFVVWSWCAMLFGNDLCCTVLRGTVSWGGEMMTRWRIFLRFDRCFGVWGHVTWAEEGRKDQGGWRKYQVPYAFSRTSYIERWSRFEIRSLLCPMTLYGVRWNDAWTLSNTHLTLLSLLHTSDWLTISLIRSYILEHPMLWRGRRSERK